MKRAKIALFLALSACGGASAAVLAPGAHVADFTLLDQAGKSHQLYALASKKAVVIMTQSNGCPIVRLAIPALREIRDSYEPKDIEFLLLNPTVQDTPDAVLREEAEFGFNMTVLLDRTQKVGEAWGVDRTAEVFVIDPKTWTLKFHGPIDDRLNYESQRPVHHRYLTDALDAVLANRPIAVSSVASPGCLINFPNRKHRY
ncbi:MAG TPA: redoxin family protein [Steroidobacteraceae bacterium]|jgi:peroxiredoxin